jgi:hypothetical protein
MPTRRQSRARQHSSSRHAATTTADCRYADAACFSSWFRIPMLDASKSWMSWHEYSAHPPPSMPPRHTWWWSPTPLPPLHSSSITSRRFVYWMLPQCRYAQCCCSGSLAATGESSRLSARGENPSDDASAASIVVAGDLSMARAPFLQKWNLYLEMRNEATMHRQFGTIEHLSHWLCSIIGSMSQL